VFTPAALTIVPTELVVPGYVVISGTKHLDDPGNATGCGLGLDFIALEYYSAGTGGFSASTVSDSTCFWEASLYVMRAGNYSVAARHANDASAFPPPLHFLALDMSTSPRTISARYVNSSTTVRTRTFVIHNPSLITLTNVTVAASATYGSLADIANLSATAPVTSLPPGTSTTVTVQFIAPRPTGVRVAMAVSADSGTRTLRAATTITIRIDAPPPLRASVSWSPSSLRGQVVMGDDTFFTLTATNIGDGPTGDIAMVLPSGAGPLSLVAPIGAVSLAPRQSVTVTIMVSPPAAAGFGRFTANMALQGATFLSSIAVSLDYVTDRLTELTVELEDERTCVAALLRIFVVHVCVCVCVRVRVRVRESEL
jgi:hypothetical protein